MPEARQSARHAAQRLQPAPKHALHEMTYAECEAAGTCFEAKYQAKYLKAVRSHPAHRRRLFSVSDSPAENRKPLRTPMLSNRLLLARTGNQRAGWGNAQLPLLESLPFHKRSAHRGRFAPPRFSLARALAK
jgi:hypothetical protein